MMLFMQSIKSKMTAWWIVKKGSEKPNGNLPLMCRITVDGEIKQFSCKMDVPKRIIEKYKGLARDGHVFPVPSNGSCNKILKEIGRQCGFKVRLTYHVARHTNIKTTQIYAKITAQKISQDMETLSHKLDDMEKNICRAI